MESKESKILGSDGWVQTVLALGKVKRDKGTNRWTFLFERTPTGEQKEEEFLAHPKSQSYFLKPIVSVRKATMIPKASDERGGGYSSLKPKDLGIDGNLGSPEKVPNARVGSGA